MLIGNRVPQDFFITTGKGQSEITIHAGSYHLALRDAGIEMANILTYSSILPKHSRAVDRPPSIAHGCVMETIMASCSARYGDTATAGLILGWLEDDSEKRQGGLVAEYNGTMPPDRVGPHLREMLNELHSNGYEHLKLVDIETHIESITPTQMYGTAIVALCFVNYRYPVIHP